MTIGVDATNIIQGGGVTHLVELLNHSNPQSHEFNQIVVWGNARTLSKIHDHPWIIKKTPARLNKSLLVRTWWKLFQLKKAIQASGCDVLFVPGGSDATGFKPMVTMSQNLLPFELKEAFKFGFTPITAKLLLLRKVQSRTFLKAEGLIFLTTYARNIVSGIVHSGKQLTAIIPHGISHRFYIEPRPQRETYTRERPCRLIYVSIVDPYKHHIELLNAIQSLKNKGVPLKLDLIGPPGHSLSKVEKMITAINKDEVIVNYLGAVSYDLLHDYYAKADIGIFASSCENMPNILLEMMAAGLPVACSSRGPMPEMLGDSGSYFDPESPASIAEAIELLVYSSQLREKYAEESFQKAQKFSWQHCADETLAFIRNIHQTYHSSKANVSDYP